VNESGETRKRLVVTVSGTTGRTPYLTEIKHNLMILKRSDTKQGTKAFMFHQRRAERGRFLSNTRKEGSNTHPKDSMSVDRGNLGGSERDLQHVVERRELSFRDQKPKGKRGAAM